MLNGYLFRTLRLKPATVRRHIASVQRLSFSSTQDNSLVRRVKHLARESDERLLTVSWNDGTTNRYPFVYLRDICKCPECFHDSSMQRAFDSVKGLHSGLIATKVDIHEEGKQIKLIWPNKHVTVFDSDWLYERRLPEENQKHDEKENSVIDEGIQLGDHTLTGNIPALKFNDVLNSKETQIKWLDLIRCHGIVIIRGASSEAGQVKKLGETLGFIVPMWFGDSLLEQNDVEKENKGDSLSSVPQATCAYDEYRGGLHLIHCLKEVFGSGGEHTFVDAFKIAKKFKNANPDTFRLLCTSNIMYQRKVANKEAEFQMKFVRPMISKANTMLMRVPWRTFTRRVLTRNLRSFQSCSTLLRSVRAKQVNPDQENRILEVKWTDGSFNRYPFVYLRENCRCPSCYHESSMQRFLHMKNLNLDSASSKMSIKENGGKIEVMWQDNHISVYDCDWLFQERIAKKTSQQQNTDFLREDVQLWGTDFELPEFDFERMLKDERSLLDWLLTLRRVGVAVLKGVLRKVGQLERLGNAVGFLKNTFYGENVALRSEHNARSLAYTSYELQPHTDLPYYEFKPSVILLQFIDQVKSPGGANTLVDGFNVVQEVKKVKPREFDLLVSTPVLWQVIGTEKIYGDFMMTFERPVIELGWTGKLARINYNEPLRVKFVNVSVENLQDVYQAYQSLTKMFYEPRFVVERKMSKGDILTMDNDRLLHGRSAFEVNQRDQRWLQQAYMDWDVLRSKTKVLKKKLGHSEQ
ncbi:uncharacterized protein LOC116288368 [Actinia tenebrosa]|uniref:Uncharacterized protein LOC116288368 n=1 Tax=Actinia tenebrosa TaxID=6105 RepID=A0A6P8HEE9_ACTTE|nr:uncharacterized protein LOC116288368 [Actinia tenebrosa]XP_031551002.1 uncharacterized protein LOC116288368 [Actinia tenebrosa]